MKKKRGFLMFLEVVVLVGTFMIGMFFGRLIYGYKWTKVTPDRVVRYSPDNDK